MYGDGVQVILSEGDREIGQEWDQKILNSMARQGLDAVGFRLGSAGLEIRFETRSDSTPSPWTYDVDSEKAWVEGYPYDRDAMIKVIERCANLRGELVFAYRTWDTRMGAARDGGTVRFIWRQRSGHGFGHRQTRYRVVLGSTVRKLPDGWTLVNAILGDDGVPLGIYWH